MNGPGSHQHRGLGMQGRYRAVVSNGASSGPHVRAPSLPSHPRNGGWHPQHQQPPPPPPPQQQQQQQQHQYAAGNKEYPYRQCPPRYHNGYITNSTQNTGCSSQLAPCVHVCACFEGLEGPRR